ncbi:MAG TPA: AmmeMemoRadiSam system protein A [Blastocatellia bacterium]|jgi:AmmeMemoRadiSam system protein A|nr:AmmeMemoRadiSam system protein A [Blastocatellia bacterium]
MPISTLPRDDILPQDLARLAVERFINEGAIIQPPEHPDGIMALAAGAFVTLRVVGGDLRGCIGTTEPVHANVSAEIIQNAIAAATRDPRFLPVTRAELASLTYGVDVLSPAEPSRFEDLDPDRFGVIIESIDAQRRALLLPRIEGIESVEHQWAAVHNKAGIALGEPVRIQRFTVTRFGKD